ncbi:MAG: S9 family peptidase [Labilithrix sp.]|nr:S9 family peptidase [Labilithrix sp.]MCW5817969.1 S9 family peptidase [Labilithrix sp.]
MKATTVTCLFPLVLVAACTPAASPQGSGPPAIPPPVVSNTPPPTATPRQASPPPVVSSYEKPPQSILDVMHSPPPPSPYASPTGERILLVTNVEYPSIARVAEPFLRLAGVRLEPRNRSKHDTPNGYGIRPCARDYTLVTVPSGETKKVALPPSGCASPPSWSVDGTKFAFLNAATESVEVWVGDAATGEVRRLEGVRANPMLDHTMQWSADQKALLVKAVVEDAGPPPPAPPVPPGPSVQESTGKGESSTYETRDTLQNKHDEDLFDYYATSQLVLVDVAGGGVKKVGKPAIYKDVDMAPDGVHVLVETVHKPYSYVTTVERFPKDVGVLDVQKGDVHKLASLPLADRVPVHGVPLGPRAFNWRSNEPATLIWAEALDGGDWKQKVPHRDKVMMQKAPFTAAPVEVTKTEHRFTGFHWGEKPDLAFLHEHDENRHWRRTFVVNVDQPTAKPRLLWDLSTDEKYKNPGTLVQRPLANGAWVVRQDGASVFLRGAGASPTGDRPFLDRLDLGTFKSERLFRSDKTAYESFVAFASPKPTERTFISWHQSPTDPPNAFLRTPGAAVSGAPPEGEPAFTSTSAPITKMPDPAPQVRAIKKRLVKYKRRDGVDLSFTLYTPPDYKEGTKVPSILYAYPLDYADAKAAGQVTGSEQTFTRLRQFRLLLLAGYAIIDNAAFPIVGDPKKAYDTYLEQLTDDAKAAVDKAVELGVVDPDRIGVTGHSHGALMTANLLAHTNLFRAGVATSGSYNKTLTPFGFQNERRSVWDAQSVYIKASPFFYADKLKLPILIMHGDDDANPGTTPLQARKLFEAIRGNGGTTRLVMLPHEPHWYTAQESNEQYLAEMLRWFDKYVKNASGPRPPAPTLPKK